MKFHFIALTLLLTAACGKSYGAKEGPAVSDAAVDAQAILGPAESPVDAMVSGRVRDAILADSVLAKDAGTVRVSTKDGVVTLSGTVSSEANKHRMDIVVNAVGSVAGVDDRLTIDPNPRESRGMESTQDRAISDRVRQAILMDKTTAEEAPNVGVSTKDGVVTLSGTVKSPVVKQRIGVVASAVGSVVRVDNELEVAP